MKKKVTVSFLVYWNGRPSKIRLIHVIDAICNVDRFSFHLDTLCTVKNANR